MDGYRHTGLQEGLVSGRQEGRAENLLQNCQALARWLWGEDYTEDLRAWIQAKNPTHPLSAEALTTLAERKLTPRDVRAADFQWDDGETEGNTV